MSQEINMLESLRFYFKVVKSRICGLHPLKKRESLSRVMMSAGLLTQSNIMVYPLNKRGSEAKLNKYKVSNNDLWVTYSDILHNVLAKILRSADKEDGLSGCNKILCTKNVPCELAQVYFDHTMLSLMSPKTNNSNCSSNNCLSFNANTNSSNYLLEM